ncbi:MAG: glycoside hydrolase family 3 N-terminal domain-containing protein [Coleofasciculaceae cyanobacterium]
MTTPQPLPNLNDSLEQQVAQMVVVRASGYLFDHQIQYPAWEPQAEQLQHLVQNIGVGGVILLGGSAGELCLRTQQLQNWANIPLLIAADIEEGVGQRFGGATWFPPPMAISAIAAKNLAQAQLYATEMGAITAKEALAIGINWLLAPIVDVNNNPQNPVINVRAFGETPEVVSKLANAFIKGAQSYGVLTTAKHFPGHGDTAVDSHIELPVLRHTPPRLAKIELPPFQEAIASGVDAIMSAHLLIPAWDEKLPATLSKLVLTNLLRDSMKFEGLIVTDALIMGAIAHRYGADEAPVMAVEAGADILLMPVNPETAIKAICDAVQSGRITKSRIQASVERIWKAKAKVIASKSQLDLTQLAQPAALNTVAKILLDSQQIGGKLPLSLEPNDGVGKFRNLIVVDDVLAADFLGRNTPAVTVPRQLGYELQFVDRNTPRQEEETHHHASKPTLLQVFIRGNPFRGSAGLTPVAEDWFQRLLKTGDLQAMVIYGSPYVLQQFLPNLPFNTPFVFSYGQMPQAQAIALDVLFSQNNPVNTSTLFL